MFTFIIVGGGGGGNKNFTNTKNHSDESQTMCQNV